MFVESPRTPASPASAKSTFFSFPEAAALVAAAFGEPLIGEDPLRTEYILLKLYRARSRCAAWPSAVAIGAIDQALWDIGQVLPGAGLGTPRRPGARQRRAMLVIPYGTIDEVVARGERRRAKGYTALKVCCSSPSTTRCATAPSVKDMVDRMAALAKRSAGSRTRHRAAPQHGAGRSIAPIRELEPFRPLFVEDPIVPDSVLGLRRGRREGARADGGGRADDDPLGVPRIRAAAGIHHIRADVGIAGGITHMRKICALAEALHVIGVVPHSVPNGPVAVASHVQLGMAGPQLGGAGAPVAGPPALQQAVKAIIPVVNGFFEAPEAPGLGIELDDEGMKTIPPASRKSDTWRREDGSIAFR